MNYALLMPNLVAFYIKLNKIYVKKMFVCFLRRKFLLVYIFPKDGACVKKLVGCFGLTAL